MPTKTTPAQPTTASRASDLDRHVVQDTHVWVVKFYSAMRGSRKEFAPEWDRAVGAVPCRRNPPLPKLPQVPCVGDGLHWGQLNIDEKENVPIAERYGVLSAGIPSVYVFNAMQWRGDEPHLGEGNVEVEPRGFWQRPSTFWNAPPWRSLRGRQDRPARAGQPGDEADGRTRRRERRGVLAGAGAARDLPGDLDRRVGLPGRRSRRRTSTTTTRMRMALLTTSTRLPWPPSLRVMYCAACLLRLGAIYVSAPNDAPESCAASEGARSALSSAATT